MSEKNTAELYEQCPICNDEIDDEKYAGGLWDLAGEICEVAGLDPDVIAAGTDTLSNQDVIYACLGEWVESKNFCPNCGRKLNGGDK